MRECADEPSELPIAGDRRAAARRESMVIMLLLLPYPEAAA
jgi:hypothetical protein